MGSLPKAQSHPLLTASTEDLATVDSMRGPPRTPAEQIHFIAHIHQIRSNQRLLTRTQALVEHHHRGWGMRSSTAEHPTTTGPKPAQASGTQPEAEQTRPAQTSLAQLRPAQPNPSQPCQLNPCSATSEWANTPSAKYDVKVK